MSAEVPETAPANQTDPRQHPSSESADSTITTVPSESTISDEEFENLQKEAKEVSGREIFS
jgi:hypothetical protein